VSISRPGCRVCFLASERPASSFQFISGPHTKHGPSGDLLGVLGHAPAPPQDSFSSSGAEAARAPGASVAAFAAASAAAAAPAAAAVSTAAAISAAAASAAVTSAASVAASVRAVKFSALLIERAYDTRSRSCASQHSRKESPGSAF
jgi:hypothetical protein